MHRNRTLIRGDNYIEMQHLSDASVDLIATDPPFNSKRDYFVPFRDDQGREPDTLVKAFTDTWTWGDAAAEAYDALLMEVGGQVGDTMEGLRKFLKETPMMAYLVMMGIRIVEMHRILKDTGSLYLHCDPTASHYLKIMLDAVFGTKHFRNEIIWHYQMGTAPKTAFGRKHDTIFFYNKSDKSKFTRQSKPVVNPARYKFTDEDGRKYDVNGVGKRYYLDEGQTCDDVWTYVQEKQYQQLNPQAKEKTGYPTQKPVELYKRIIAASSNEGDLVLDPFCGCGTTLMAAESLNRHWIGIDLTYLAIGAVNQQFDRMFPQHRDSVTIAGTPENAAQALALAQTDHQGFEEWCITHVLHFKSNAKKVADGGIDGTFRFPIGKVKGKQEYGRVVAQVKGGSYTLGHIRDFRTAMQNDGADLGVFVVTSPPSSGMRTEASRAGIYRHPFLNMEAPALQIYEIQDYFEGNLPTLPFGERSLL